MNREKRGWERLKAWVNGENSEKEGSLFSMAPRPQKEKKSYSVDEKTQKKQLHGFLNWYPLASLLIGLLVAGVLLAAVLALPPFGEATNPTNNELPRHYLTHTIEQTGATNAVAGMILNYRGFDTFGESCVLFLAVTCVFMLLQKDENNSPLHENSEREELREDVILQQVSLILLPMIFLFGLYMLLNGHLSPGGGFSGGAILGAGLILYASAFGPEKLRRFFSARIFDLVRVSGLMLYAVLFGYYIFTGANGLPNHIVLTYGGLILPIDVAVGMVVACTMYGFYAMFTRGEL